MSTNLLSKEEVIFKEIIEHNFGRKNFTLNFALGFVAQLGVLWGGYKLAIYIWRMLSCPC